MDRHEQLTYCRVCGNKAFDPEKGIICGLTREPAAFENECPDFKGNKDDIWKLELAEREKPGNRFLALFTPRKDYFITPLIADICLVVFLVITIAGGGFFTPDHDVMLKWGAGYKALILDGQYWRLISSFFIHFGISCFL